MDQLSKIQATELAKQHGTPLFVYSRAALQKQAQTMLATPAPYGLTVRFAMKANPFVPILELFKEEGLAIDASSGYEAERALQAGYQPSDILLTAQQLAHNMQDLVKQGVQFNATSLRQLEAYGQAFPGTKVSVRINPGVGSGHSAKVNVGGPTSSFGIWHEYLPLVKEMAEKYKLTIERLHTHIGAGTDPAVWLETAKISLKIIEQLPTATILNLGGGFKVARLPEEKSANMSKIGDALNNEITRFAEATGRKLHLELEPGTFLVANAGSLLATVDDVVDTGKDGYNFIKLNTGMNDILRPTLYGAQHPLDVLTDNTEERDYVVVGHNCESGDLLTPAPGEAEVLGARLLPITTVGDLVVIRGAGAYCASMAAHGYNSYPNAKETMVE